MDARNRRAREVQAQVRRILMDAWDPIGVRTIPEGADEYDAYVGGVYRLLAEGATEDDLARHLLDLQARNMGLPPDERGRAASREAARRLVGLDVGLPPAGA